MNYLIKVITPEFKELMEQWIDNKTLGLAGNKRQVERLNLRQNLFLYWSGKMKLSAPTHQYRTNEEFQAALKGYFGIVAVPDYVELCVQDMRTGLDARAKIMWNGEITRIIEIPVVFSYEPAPANIPLSTINRRLS